MSPRVRGTPIGQSSAKLSHLAEISPQDIDRAAKAWERDAPVTAKTLLGKPVDDLAT